MAQWSTRADRSSKHPLLPRGVGEALEVGPQIGQHQHRADPDHRVRSELVQFSQRRQIQATR